MAGLRVQLLNILENHERGDRSAAIEDSVALVSSLDAEGKGCALAYNLAGDLMFEQSSDMTDPKLAKFCIEDAVFYYKSSAELVPSCIETAASYGAALLALYELDMALYELDMAEVELRRGMSIRAEECVHPFVHNIKIKQGAGTKEELIDDAKRRMESDLSYVKVCKADWQFAKIVNQFGKANVQATKLLDAAKKLARKLPNSARAKSLYPQVVLGLLRTGKLNGQEIGRILQSALKIAHELTISEPTSLVFAMCYAKLLISVGFYGNAEKEFLRAVSIESPHDPRDHDIPLGHTKGVKYTDRVLVAKEKIRRGLASIVDQVCKHFEVLGEDLKSHFLSISVEKILENNETDLVSEALEYYRASMSWVLWKCPLKDHVCQLFSASTPQDMLLHVSDHATACGKTLPEMVSDTLIACAYVPNDAPHCGLYLTTDDEGRELVCVKKLEYLFKGINDVVVGVKSETNPPDVALANFLDHLSTVECPEVLHILENLWLEFLKSAAMDKREALMRVIAALKWEDLKEMVETQITGTQMPSLDVTMESEMVMDEPTPEPKGKITGTPSCHYAFKYKHRALHHRLSVINAVTSSAIAKMKEKEERFDPYDNESLHKMYVKDLPHMVPHLVLCSACYFERAINRRFSQLLHHFSVLHGSNGVKCHICSARFATASALAYHMKYCHDVDPVNQQVDGVPD